MYYLCALSLNLSGCQVVSNMITGAGISAVMLEPHVSYSPLQRLWKKQLLRLKQFCLTNGISPVCDGHLGNLKEKAVLKSRQITTGANPHATKHNVIFHLKTLTHTLIVFFFPQLVDQSLVCWLSVDIWEANKSVIFPHSLFSHHSVFSSLHSPHFCQGGPLTQFPLQILKRADV